MKNFFLKFALCALLCIPLLAMEGCSKDSTDEKTQGPAPVLTVKLADTNTLNVSAAGGPITLSYEVANPVEGKTVSASSRDSWIHDIDVSVAGKVSFVVDENTTDDLVRTGTVVLSYPGAEDVTVNVAQEAPAVPIRLEVTNVSLHAAAVEGKADDPSLTFLFGVVKKSEYDSFGGDDAAFMSSVIESAGESIIMNCYMGENNGTLTETPTLFKVSYDYKGNSIASGEDYYLFAFGYMGGTSATTALFKVSAKSSGESSGGGDGGWWPEW